MKEIKSSFPRWIILPLIGFLALFLVIVLNQSIQLVTWAFGIHEVLGYAVLLLLGLIFAGLIIYPMFKIMLYRAVPEVPSAKDSPDYPEYVASIHEILKSNTFLAGKELAMTGENKELEAENAFRVLETEADRFIKTEATQVFLTTAVSQNGSLDGIFVLTSLIKLIWRITHLYEARPSLRKLLYIYANVAGTVLIARGIEDLDLIEDQVEPLVSSLIGGSIMSVVPGAVPVTNLIVLSVMEGSINALLTLRCGFITKRYLGSLTIPDKKAVRRSSSLEAVSKIGAIITENSLHIIKSFAGAAKNAALNVTTSKFSFGKKTKAKADAEALEKVLPAGPGEGSLNP